MAKKQAARERDAGKTRFELRFDDDLYARTKSLADRAGISVNQLMQGLARWFIERAQTGEPYRGTDGSVYVREQEGCVWAGSRACRFSDEERMQMAQDDGCAVSEMPREDKGNIVLFLDFTERRVVREDV
jgi:hypothetical protein